MSETWEAAKAVTESLTKAPADAGITRVDQPDVYGEDVYFVHEGALFRATVKHIGDVRGR